MDSEANVRGASAKSIYARITGKGEQRGDYPKDAGDFGRCEALLDAQPQLREQLNLMADVNAYWRALVPEWGAIKASNDITAAIKAIVEPIEAVDPGFAKLGPNASLRAGKITFKGGASLKPEPVAEAVPESALLSQAALLVWSKGVASTSLIQRSLGIGYNAAARLIERLEDMAIVSKANHVGKRTVRSPDDLRAAMNIRQELTDIAGEESAAILIKALVAGLKTAHKEEPMAAKGHNSGDVTAAYNITAEELRQFIERFEQLESEKKDVTEQQKELMAEAKGRGYDTKIMKKLVALRKRKPDDIAEEEAVLEMYKAALEMV